MEASNMSNGDNNDMALKALIDAFGPTLSLKDITSAYHKAEKNADLAGEILFEMQGSASSSSECAPSRQPLVVESSIPTCELVSDKSKQFKNGNFRAPKQKWRPVSGGTVSGIIGKDYVKPMPTANGCARTKPIKLDAEVLPASLIWGEENRPDLSKNGEMEKDMGDFLFKMLGDGFQLEKDVIQQVLDDCGYDMHKSMEKLLDLPSFNKDGGDTSVGKPTKETSEVHSSANGSGQKGISNQQEKRNELQKDVLTALFNASEKSTEALRQANAGRRSRTLGPLVVGPPEDFAVVYKDTPVVSNQEANDVADDNDEEEDAYLQLRTAVKEHRATMKEYYKAAVDAFAKADYDLADGLMNEGQVFRDKARKADDESRQIIFETKKADTQDEVMLDLHEHGAKEAYRLLKHHLSLFSGIESIKYLKVIIETSEVDTSKGARRRLVMKLLEKESVEWREGGEAGTIVIRMDNIKRKA